MSVRVLKGVFVAVVLAAIATAATMVLTVCCAAGAAQANGAVVEGRVVDVQGGAIPGATVRIEQSQRLLRVTTTNGDGRFTFDAIQAGAYQLRVVMAGFQTATREVALESGRRTVQVPAIVLSVGTANEAVVQDSQAAGRGGQAGRSFSTLSAPPPGAPYPMASPSMGAMQAGTVYRSMPDMYPPPVIGRPENYARVPSNRFKRTADEPLSTFGADVDTASFANVRRFLRNGQLPPRDAVRVEEFINYFRFDYQTPRGPHPIGVTTEVADAPWNPRHKLVLIGARAVAPGNREIAGRNIVLLVDVSGSMAPADKLPLLKSALGLFVDMLQPSDRIAIVTYAGSSGVALPPTPARDRSRILAAIGGLGAGGSTNGAGGITMAYQLARESFIERGVNRVILATDGDFNVGVTSHEGLLNLIEREKESGVFLSVLGVGTGNLQDSTMEMLADKGNGHYSYLDSLQEAKRVLVNEVGSTLETVAKDVKFQVEFNPAEVASWKLIGYENRLLAHEDFNDDRKDGGEVGAGHTVTVLYEIVPVGVALANDDGDDSATRPDVDPLRYQSRPESRPAPTPARRGEWLTVKVRYQQPEGSTSRLISVPVAVRDSVRPEHVPFAASVAEYGLLLREGRAANDRWTALVRRLEAMPVAASLRADRDHLVELVSLARDLARLR